MHKFNLVPVSLRQAREFCDAHHRHNLGSKAYKFSIGLQLNGEMIGCAIAGRPVSRYLDDGATIEILRVCIDGYYKNASSMLYGACCRAARAMGYKFAITYTFTGESGASLKASGFQSEGEQRYNNVGWDRKNRRREMPERYPEENKIRWRRCL